MNIQCNLNNYKRVRSVISKLTILLQHYFTMGICRSGVDCNKSRIKPEYSNFLLFSDYFGSVFFLLKVRFKILVTGPQVN